MDYTTLTLSMTQCAMQYDYIFNSKTELILWLMPPPLIICVHSAIAIFGKLEDVYLFFINDIIIIHPAMNRPLHK